MSFLDSALSSLGFEYFCSGDEYLLLFRGAVIDHPVLVRESEAFVHATAVLCRVPDPLGAHLSAVLLEWNAHHSMARLAVTNRQALALAELPLQGLRTEGVETLILSVASAAEEFSQRVLPGLLSASDWDSGAEPAPDESQDYGPDRPSRPEPAADPGVPQSPWSDQDPGSAPVAFPVVPEEPDIDWETEG
ncbi:MAG TPA: YbjN domain-containing protein [Armatimonadota bacterium]|nr:YbjN domain-containing protein [Armatimonadota bacterium]